ncbi:MAG TPA: T9SS type A sorting domain-containing protein, partial [Bacteroidales bacterium]|nr:T9SS type A sorting domain-containing protein [Bacteroidales bacterium]
QQLIFLIGDNNKQLYELRLVDINGQTVLKSQITSGENSTVNIGELPMGLYIVIANNSQKAFTRKVIIN